MNYKLEINQLPSSFVVSVEDRILKSVNLVTVRLWGGLVGMGVASGTDH